MNDDTTHTTWSLPIGVLTRDEAIARTDAHFRALEAAQFDRIAADIVATTPPDRSAEEALEHLNDAREYIAESWEEPRDNAKATVAKSWDRFHGLS